MLIIMVAATINANDFLEVQTKTLKRLGYLPGSFFLLDNCKLLIMDAGIFEKLCLEPDICMCRCVTLSWPGIKWSRPTSRCPPGHLPQFWIKTVIAQPPGAQLTQILFLQLVYCQTLMLGTGSSDTKGELSDFLGWTQSLFPLCQDFGCFLLNPHSKIWDFSPRC